MHQEHSESPAVSLQTGKLPTAPGIEISDYKLQLPESHKPYTDVYFRHSKHILEEMGLNPFVRSQVFLRGAPGDIYGINEAIAIIDKYTDITKNGGRVYALPEGSPYTPIESVLVVEARVQDIVELETMVLGVIAAETTKRNDGVERVDLVKVEERVKQLVDLIDGRPLVYMGPRHWRYDEDQAIAAAAARGGAIGTSTAIGAGAFSRAEMGSMPHALETIFAHKFGRENAVVEAARAFGQVIDPKIPLYSLIDFNNREIDDTVRVLAATGSRLTGVRIDTCGENFAQGGAKTVDDPFVQKYIDRIPPNELKYWFGKGVTVSGTVAVYDALHANGGADKQVLLSSGFAKVDKLQAFVNAENILGRRIFDAVGAGGVFGPCRQSTMDVVAVADDINMLDQSPMSKVGRSYHPNSRLERVL